MGRYMHESKHVEGNILKQADQEHLGTYQKFSCPDPPLETMFQS